jgi:hypothetical protein
MPKCRVCENHGESEDVFMAHNHTDFKVCEYHPRYVKELRKKVTRGDGAFTDELGATELREHFPSPTKRGGRPDIDTTPRIEPKDSDEITNMVADAAIKGWN